MIKILLVEDNEMNRDMLLRRLRRRGYEVSIAVDGAESIEKVNGDRPHLILMDMSLPVMDGYQATRILKENPATRSIPVLGLSAHAMTGDADKALDAGCDDYDTKPVEIKRLLGKIEVLLDRDGLAPPERRTTRRDSEPATAPPVASRPPRTLQPLPPRPGPPPPPHQPEAAPPARHELPASPPMPWPREPIDPPTDPDLTPAPLGLPDPHPTVPLPSDPFATTPGLRPIEDDRRELGDDPTSPPLRREDDPSS